MALQGLIQDFVMMEAKVKNKMEGTFPKRAAARRGGCGRGYPNLEHFYVFCPKIEGTFYVIEGTLV